MKLYRYAIGYNDFLFIDVIFDFDFDSCTKFVTQINFNGDYGINTFTTFDNKEEAINCLKEIQNNEKKIRFKNHNIIDDILEEGNDTYKAKNLKVFRLVASEIEEEEK